MRSVEICIKPSQTKVVEDTLELAPVSEQHKYYFSKRAPKNRTGTENQLSGAYVNTMQNVYWGPSSIPGCNRGVFANKDFAKGDVVEISPIIVDTDENWGEGNVIEDYTMDFDTKKETSSLMLGYAGLYNHSDRHNIVSEYGNSDTIIFYAHKKIKRHEEMFINYGKSWWKGRGIEPTPKKLSGNSEEKNSEEKSATASAAAKSKRKAPAKNKISKKTRKTTK